MVNSDLGIRCSSNLYTDLGVYWHGLLIATIKAGMLRTFVVIGATLYTTKSLHSSGRQRFLSHVDAFEVEPCSVWAVCVIASYHIILVSYICLFE